MDNVTGLNETGTARRERRERVVAWITNGLACLYCVWLGAHLWRLTTSFVKIFEGLGAELPASTRFVIEHRAWLFPAMFAALVATLVIKEVFVRDKRLSTMVTCFVAILAQFLAQWLTTLYYLPLFNLVNKVG